MRGLEAKMKTVIAAVVLLIGPLATYGQLGQDLKNVGGDLKDAAVTGVKKTGKAIGKATKKASESSIHVVKKGTHEAAYATAKGANKVADKTSGT